MTGSGKRFAWVLAGALLVALAFTAAAQAQVFCVNDPACVAAGGTEKGTTGKNLAEALAAAASHPNSGETPDEVLIGAGEYSLEAGFSYTSAEAVIVRGAGAGSTVLTRPATGGADVLLLRSPESIVEGVTIRAPEVEDLQGARLEGGTFEADTIEAPAGATDVTGLRLESGTFTHGTVSVASGTDIDQRGGEVLYSTIGGAAAFGVQVSLKGALRGDVISGATPIVSYYAKPLILEDSLIEMGRADQTGVEIAGNINGYTEAFLRQDAIVGGGHKGLVVSASTNIAAVSFENSIIAEAEVPVEVIAQEKGVLATVLGEYSSFEESKDVERLFEEDAPALTDANPVAALPSFVSPLTGDFHLAPGSPLIDAGAPGSELQHGELKTDLEGNPRIVHGRRDVGPYEYQWRPPAVTGSVNAMTAVKGEVLTFSGSASAAEPGDSVTGYQWTFDDGGAVHPGAAASHAFTTLGSHTATLTATDAAGVIGTATVAVDVVGEACAYSGCGGHPIPRCGCLPPHLRSLALSPRSLHAARKGSSVGRGHAGARVSYRLAGEPRTLVFTVLRKRSGVRSGKRCLAAGKGRHGKRCTLRVKVPGSFEQSGKLGPNSFRFTGRIGGRTLAPGSYELMAVIKGSSGSGVEAPFTVLG